LRHEISTESSGMRFRGGALKTDWAKPWHGGAGYGDRIAPLLLSGAFERAGAGGSAAPAAYRQDQAALGRMPRAYEAFDAKTFRNR